METASGLSMSVTTGNRHRTVHIDHESLVACFILQEEIEVSRYQYQGLHNVIIDDDTKQENAFKLYLS